MVVDGGGGFIKGAHLDASERAQRLAKAKVIAEAWVDGGIDAAALADSDWELGTEAVLALVRDSHLPVLAANLECGGSAPFPSSKVVESGGRRVGIVGLTHSPGPGCVASDPIVAAREARQALGAVDLAVLLAPLPQPRMVALGEAALGFDVVVDGASSKQREVPEALGNAWVVSAGTRGKYVGLLQVEFRDGASGFWVGGERERLQGEVDRLAQRLAEAETRRDGAADERAKARFERQVKAYSERLVGARESLAAVSGDGGGRNVLRFGLLPLSTAVGEHAPTVARVDAVKKQVETIETGGQALVVAAERRGPEGSAFAGAAACVACHPAEDAQWAATGHARAWQSLVADGRAMDRDCFRCHVTGAGMLHGPAEPSAVGGLRDVQCETCHGPAAAHVADPENRHTVRDPGEAGCVGCHDGIQDGGRFDYASYRPKIVHGSGG